MKKSMKKGIISEILEYFEDITDPKQAWKTDYDLHEIIIMTIYMR